MKCATAYPAAHAVQTNPCFSGRIAAKKDETVKHRYARSGASVTLCSKRFFLRRRNPEKLSGKRITRLIRASIRESLNP
jgi:hypothetical protein